MNSRLLQQAVNGMKQNLEAAITSASFGLENYENGHAAKEALIRSQKPILPVHEVVKRSLAEELSKTRRQFDIHPPLNTTSPELRISGFIKAKKQDVVVLFDGAKPRAEPIRDGALVGERDVVGQRQSERSIIVGVRSQVSSVAKNFDTLMERAFAETLNLRLRLPAVTMGEVYVLAVYGYDNRLMKKNAVGWTPRPTSVGKFIKTFLAITDRLPQRTYTELYKYERSALVLVDFRPNSPKILPHA
jgi:hypothetical protein